MDPKTRVLQSIHAELAAERDALAWYEGRHGTPDGWTSDRTATFTAIIAADDD